MDAAFGMILAWMTSPITTIDNHLAYAQSMIPSVLYTHFSTYSKVYIHLYSLAMSLFTTFNTFVNAAIKSATEKGDFTSILVLLVVGILSVQLTMSIARSVVATIKLFLTLAFWGGIVTVLIYISMRGMDGFLNDLDNIFKIWQTEYDNYKFEAEYRRVTGAAWVRY